MDTFLVFGLGLLCAAVGGELFIRGIVGVAQWMRVPARIIGVTLAAFATSSPELSVSTMAALEGKPQLGLGDALGSNVVNVALILGLALLASGIQTTHENVKRDFLVAMGIPIVIGILALDGIVSRTDGFLLLGIFLVWLTITIAEARRHRNAAEKGTAKRVSWRSAAMTAVGLAVLVAAGHLIVIGAKSIAGSLGLSEFVIGATLVAVGTGTPELATTVISNIRGHHELGLGNILGSNIFNGLLIVAVAAILYPISIHISALSVALIFGVLTVAASLPTKDGFIGRKRGVLLLALYAFYVVLILLQGHAS